MTVKLEGYEEFEFSRAFSGISNDYQMIHHLKLSKEMPVKCSILSKSSRNTPLPGN